MHTRIVAFLGRAETYVTCHYELAERALVTKNPALVHHEIWFALAKQLASSAESPQGSQTSLIVVGSDDTRADFLGPSSGLRREIALHLGQEAARALPIAFLRYDQAVLRDTKAQHGDPFWSLFEDLRRVLSPEPLELEGALTHVQGDAEVFTKQAAQHLIVDVTHGFRAVPLLAVAVLQFVVAERRSVKRYAALSPASGARPAPVAEAIHHILYGALDDTTHEGDTVPVWNLTPLMAAPRWAGALDAFMCYGRADDLRALGEEEASNRVDDARARKAPVEQLARAKVAERFGDAAANLADDLALVRLRDLFTISAKRMKDFLDGPDGADLATQIPPLKGALGRLRRWVGPLDSVNVLQREGVDAMAHLAAVYGLLQRFAEQAIAVREGLVSHYALQVGHRQPEPGSGCHAQRRPIDTEWGTSARNGSSPRAGRTAENLTLSMKAKDTRNDLVHAGLNDNPSKADKLRAQFERWTSEFQQLVATVRKP